MTVEAPSQRFGKAHAGVPGPRGLPFLGVIPAFIRNPLRYFEQACKSFGPIFRLPLGGRSIVFVNNAELAGKLLGSEFQDFAIGSSTAEALEPLLGQSLPIALDPALWQQIHDQMIPMFTPKMLRHYFEVTVDSIQDELAVLGRHADSGEPIDLYDAIRHGMFTALTRTMFVRGLDEREIPGLLDLFTSANKYVSARYLTNSSPLIMAIPSVRRGKRDLDRINARADRLVEERRSEPAHDATDMLDVLINAKSHDGHPFTVKQVRENMVALWFGGQETTPTITTWAFGLLASNPEIRDRVFAEVDEVLDDRRPTYADLDRLEYTSGVADEAMRLYPPFVFIGREALKDVELGGYDIKKGEQLGFVGWTIHREEENWPDPERVDPERHFSAQRKTRHRVSFLAFGHGKRRCIGARVGKMESTLMLAMTAQRFRLDHVDGKMPEPVVQNAIKPKNRMRMFVVNR